MENYNIKFQNCLRAHFETKALLRDEQFGFREKISCEMALSLMIEDSKSWLDKRYSVAALFVDLRNAFDSVNHKLLLTNLELNFPLQFEPVHRENLS